MLTKLRRGESFGFSWEYGRNEGGGRGSVFCHPEMALRFDFESSGRTEFNPLWLDVLAKQANLPDGLVILEEPQSPEHIRDLEQIPVVRA